MRSAQCNPCQQHPAQESGSNGIAIRLNHPAPDEQRPFSYKIASLSKIIFIAYYKLLLPTSKILFTPSAMYQSHQSLYPAPFAFLSYSPHIQDHIAA